MSIKKFKDDLSKLEEIAQEQGKQLNLSFVLITIKPQDNELQEVLNYFEERNIQIINSDVEPDDIPDNNFQFDNNINPFDPSKIDIKMDKMTMDSIIKRIKFKEFEFDSEFQRKAGLWNPIQKSQLIESILLKIPLPAFYFDATNDDKWLIIDGLQRIGTIKEFVVDKSLVLTGMEFLKELNGLNFDKLPRSLQRRIEETNVNAYLVNPATPANVKFNIFKRINTGGLVLEAQEIRNALYQGQAAKFIKELAKLKEFRDATDNSINADRMLDREFCLRYVAFTYVSLDKYTGSIDDFLNTAMEFLNSANEQYLYDIKNDFVRSMIACKNIFEKHTFRKMSKDGKRRPINKAIFEIWSNIIHSLSDNEIVHIVKERNRLLDEFIKLCGDNGFLNALKASDKKYMIQRISAAKNIVKEILEGGEDQC